MFRLVSLLIITLFVLSSVLALAPVSAADLDRKKVKVVVRPRPATTVIIRGR